MSGGMLSGILKLTGKSLRSLSGDRRFLFFNWGVKVGGFTLLIAFQFNFFAGYITIAL